MKVDLENNDNHETCHLDLNFQSHDSYFVEFAPTIIHEKKFAYVESSKFSMQFTAQYIEISSRSKSITLSRANSGITLVLCFISS